MARMIINTHRVIERDKAGNPTRTIPEHFSIVHPDDLRGRDASKSAHNDISYMLRTNPDYINTTYTKTEDET